ncbi:MAG: M48 family metallopeptidase [Ardenticatenaceae bacterium]|nr:M48 family metallopeptidase [Anaerolineales bacterium]MCB8917498.1 M48 family metallopeptidase [Ardenticatenaceae bacterium]
MSEPPNDQEWPVEIIRSDRRRKSVSARLVGGKLVVRAPAGMSDADLAPIIANLRQRLARRTRPVPQSDETLQTRTQELNRQYFNGRLHWRSIRYVTNQQKRFGSCTPATGTIRISHRLAAMPAWVRDYVIIHELAHLEQANHGPRFWALVNRYPLAERARGYLMASGLEQEDGEAVDWE